MVRAIRKLLLVIFLLNLLSCTSARVSRVKHLTPQEELKAGIDYLVNDANLQNAHLGLFIESLSEQKILYALNEYKLFIPASNMKLFTTAAAFDLLGEDFRFKTTFKMTGWISGDTLKGNLIVRGGGDPTFSGRFYNGCTLCVFNAWCDSLRERGIRVIEGDILADNSYFDGPALGEGWDWDDLPYWYAAESSALSLNDNCVDLIVSAADTTGVPVIVKTDPCVKGVEIVNNAVTGAKDSVANIRINRDLGDNTIIVSGQLPLFGRPIRRSVTVHDPEQFFINALTEVFKDNHIQILGKEQDVLKDSVSLLFDFYSPPLRQIVNVVNKRSQNFYAEQLLRVMGAFIVQDGSFEGGARVVQNWVKTIGIDDDDFIMVDGSGLSRKNFITPKTISRLLEFMSARQYFLQFYNSLPVSGVDGTLKYRMIDTPAANHVHAKTGSMSHVKNLSGYLRGKDGKLYLFVILTNNFSVPSSYISNFQDRICVLLYRYSNSFR